MQIVVITGSTRGLGYGLADAFLARDCAVVVSGRTREAVDRAASDLAARHDQDRVLGQPCDVTDYGQVQALWDVAQARFGRVDVWINNAGIAHAQTPFGRYDPAQIRAVVETNLVGAMYGAQVALNGMRAQGHGALYNMEGLGSDGRRVEGLGLYGTTKHGLAYLTDALVAETEGTALLVGALRPGMVVTDMLTQQYDLGSADWERAKRIFNILADRVETVAPWLADQVLANRKHGARFHWLGRARVLGRFLRAPFRKRDLFA